jgi:nitrous oxide reductase accessory protein NosL
MDPCSFFTSLPEREKKQKNIYLMLLHTVAAWGQDGATRWVQEENRMEQQDGCNSAARG